MAPGISDPVPLQEQDGDGVLEKIGINEGGGFVQVNQEGFDGFKFIGDKIKGFLDFIVGIGEKIFEGLQKAWDFITNLPGKIGDTFKKGWDWITGGDKTEEEYKGEPIKNARGRTIGYIKPEGD